LVGATLDVRLTATMVELLHAGTRVAAHARDARKGRATTDPGHRPKSHQRHLEWSPSRLVHWGESLGPSTGRVVAEILARFPHPEQGYRACLGLLSLERKYDRPRVEGACTRALATGAVSYRSVKSMLATGVDQLSLADGADATVLRLPLTHEHIRGADYYRRALTLVPTADPTEDLPHAD
jgi:transposase